MANATHLRWQQYSSVWRRVVDEFTIVKSGSASSL